ncbi:unnamed protein product [Gadus morhua 'NCC']
MGVVAVVGEVGVGEVVLVGEVGEVVVVRKEIVVGEVGAVGRVGEVVTVFACSTQVEWQLLAKCCDCVAQGFPAGPGLSSQQPGGGQPHGAGHWRKHIQHPALTHSV